MKNGFGLVRQLEDQFLLGADGAQVQVLDVWEEAAFHLVEQQKQKWELKIRKSRPVQDCGHCSSSSLTLGSSSALLMISMKALCTRSQI